MCHCLGGKKIPCPHEIIVFYGKEATNTQTHKHIPGSYKCLGNGGGDR